MSTNEFAQAARLDTIRYSQVWEDHLLAEQALAVGPDDDVLAIASGGCNALALLAAGARSVTAVDVSPAQLALCELKVAGIRRLEHADFLVLLGAAPGSRAALYARVRDDLSAAARAFWDAHAADLDEGVLRCGRLERYLLAFAAEHLARLIPAPAVARLLALADPPAQAELFAREIASDALADAFHTFIGRDNLAARGRDAAQFRYVPADVDVGRHFWDRFRWACTRLPARGNFYLEWFLTGRHADPAAAHPYLRPATFARLRPLLPRLRLVLADLGAALAAAPPGAYSKATLSDVFEYMSEDAAAALLETIARRFRRGGRICYWNLLVPRSRPPALAPLLSPRRAEADALWRADRSWFYRAFHVEEITTP